MQLIFLGTGTSQGVPVIGCKCDVCKSTDEKDKRLRASALVELDGRRILVDAGPDFRQQLLRADIDALDGILVTHAHKDHIAGLDDVRALNYCSGKPVDIYGESIVLDAIRNEFSYAFAKNPYPGVPEMRLNEITSEPFTVSGIKITPIRVMHHKLPIFGFRIANLTYITDANYIADREIDKVKGSDILVLNALRREPHISHFTLAQALEMSAKIAPRVTYFTHMSHYLSHNEIEKELPANIHLAYDGLTVDVQ